MLMATLTVVSTAQTRTYQKFEENQADFTSRSALEFFTEHMMTNNDSAYKTTRKDPYAPTQDMTMGRDIECDIRSLKSLDKDESTSLTWNASSPPHRTAAFIIHHYIRIMIMILMRLRLEWIATQKKN
jgi:hypothetical protein